MVFTLLLSIAAKAGLFGIPLAFIVMSGFFKYAYILFDQTVSGYDEPPTLDIQMLNPLNGSRPLAQVLILCLIYAAVKFTQHAAGPTAALILTAPAILLLPASVAILVSARAWPLVRPPVGCYRRRWISGSTSSMTVFSLMALPSAVSRRSSSSVAVSFSPQTKATRTFLPTAARAARRIGGISPMVS